MQLCKKCPWRDVREFAIIIAEQEGKAHNYSGPHACHVRAGDKWVPENEREACAGHAEYLKD